jgi:dTDP-4-dehydrorhamnose reductase
MKIFIAGLSGFLGERLAQHLSLSHDVQGCFFNTEPSVQAESQRLDLAGPARQIADLLEGMRPDVVVNAAAISQPQIYAKDPEQCARVNVDAPLQMARWCRKRQRPFLTLSSDTVYADATVHIAPTLGWSEQADLLPLTAYAQSKMQMEKAVLNCFPDATVLRSSLLWGRAPKGRNSFSQWLLSRYEAGLEIPVFKDNFRHALSMHSLVRTLESCLHQPPLGIMNVGSREFMSRDIFAQKLFSHLSLESECLIAGRTADANLADPIPLELPLCLHRFESWLDGPLPSIAVDLKREYSL